MARRICEGCPRWVEEEQMDPATGKRCPVCKQPTRGRQAFVIRTTGANHDQHTLEGRALHDGTKIEYLMANGWQPAVVRMKPWSGATGRVSPIVYALPEEKADVSTYPVRLARTA
jgi:hypothetical protein